MLSLKGRKQAMESAGACQVTELFYPGNDFLRFSKLIHRKLRRVQLKAEIPRKRDITPHLQAGNPTRLMVWNSADMGTHRGSGIDK